MVSLVFNNEFNSRSGWYLISVLSSMENNQVNKDLLVSLNWLEARALSNQRSILYSDNFELTKNQVKNKVSNPVFNLETESFY